MPRPDGAPSGAINPIRLIDTRSVSLVFDSRRSEFAADGGPGIERLLRLDGVRRRAPAKVIVQSLDFRFTSGGGQLEYLERMP